MTDFRAVLLFLSFSLRAFLVHLLLNLGYFTLLVAIIVPVFMVCFAAPGEAWWFWGFLGLLIPSSHMLRRFLFLKPRVRINADFLRFMPHIEALNQSNGETGESPAPVPKPLDNSSFPRRLEEITGKIKGELKAMGAGRIPLKLLIVLAAEQVIGQGSELPSMEVLKRFRQECFRLTVTEILVFILLLLPFAFIAFLFTLTVAGSLVVLIFVVGGIFALYLHTVLVVPMTGMMLQKRVYESK